MYAVESGEKSRLGAVFIHIGCHIHTYRRQHTCSVEIFLPRKSVTRANTCERVTKGGKAESHQEEAETTLKSKTEHPWRRRTRPRILRQLLWSGGTAPQRMDVQEEHTDLCIDPVPCKEGERHVERISKG